MRSANVFLVAEIGLIAGGIWSYAMYADRFSADPPAPDASLYGTLTWVCAFSLVSLHVWSAIDAAARARFGRRMRFGFAPGRRGGGTLALRTDW